MAWLPNSHGRPGAFVRGSGPNNKLDRPTDPISTAPASYPQWREVPGCDTGKRELPSSFIKLSEIKFIISSFTCASPVPLGRAPTSCVLAVLLSNDVAFLNR